MKRHLSLLIALLLLISCVLSGCSNNDDGSDISMIDTPIASVSSIPENTDDTIELLPEETLKPDNIVVPSPEPVSIPEPTSTPEPSSTPEPINTLKPTITPLPIPEEPIPSSLPYRLEIDVTNQIVSAYEKDSDGQYTKLVRRMICSTGKSSTPTPLGSFAIPDGPYDKGRWGYFSKYGVWAQYFTRIKGGILFHSIIYSKNDVSTLKKSTFDALSTGVSAGCIRLLVPDAKWIYDNAHKGTIVDVVEKEKDAQLTASLKPSDIFANSDKPVEILPVSLSLDGLSKLELKVGDTVTLKATVDYSNNTTVDETEKVEWLIEKDGIVTITNNIVQAITPGTTMITAQYKNVTASLEITVLENITPEPTTEVPTPEPTMEIPTPEPPIVEEAAPTPTIP